MLYHVTLKGYATHVRGTLQVKRIISDPLHVSLDWGMMEQQMDRHMSAVPNFRTFSNLILFFQPKTNYTLRMQYLTILYT